MYNGRKESAFIITHRGEGGKGGEEESISGKWRKKFGERHQREETNK